MDAFYMTCAGIATASVVVAVVYLVRTLEQVRKTAEQAQKTAQSIEQLATHLDEGAQAVGGVTQSLAEFSMGLRSGWGRLAQLAVGLVSGFRSQKWGDDEEERPQREPRGNGGKPEEQPSPESTEQP